MQKVSAALVKAQAAFGPALKNSVNGHLKNKYANLESALNAVTGALNANGLALIQKTHFSDGGVTVETVVIHESGEQLSGGVLFVPSSKTDAQGFGSALSYARRYSVMTFCGIAAEDDDGQHAVRAAPKVNTDAFEVKHLEALREAALDGEKELQRVFKAIPASPEKTEFWKQHGESLKAAAKQGGEHV